MEKAYAETATMFKAFSDPKRLKILDLLGRQELCGCDLLEKLDMSQSTLSHHMKILVNSHIVTRRREGKRIFYILNPEGCKQAKALLAQLTCMNRECQDAEIENRGGCK
jgi:ArsR family transcriptional regulator